MDFSLPAHRVIRILKQVMAWSGKPQVIRCDNGPDTLALRCWTGQARIEQTQPGKPQQNGYVKGLERLVCLQVSG